MWGFHLKNKTEQKEFHEFSRIIYNKEGKKKKKEKRNKTKTKKKPNKDSKSP